MTESEILTTAIKTYGEQAQERQAIEECSELISQMPDISNGEVKVYG